MHGIRDFISSAERLSNFKVQKITFGAKRAKSDFDILATQIWRYNDYCLFCETR